MSFDSLGLHPSLLKALADMGWEDPTPIQRDAIPPAMEGRDILAAAETGSGKTGAFLLPILHKLLPLDRGRTRALVLSPTRELALQTEEQFREMAAHTDLSTFTIMGGVAMGPQDQAFKKGVDLLVATPGRLLDHLENRRKDLDQLEYVVLDEADRMLDMGFMPDISKILDWVPEDRQSLLFSATLPQAIISLAGVMLEDPVKINVQRRAVIPKGISHHVYRVPHRRKRALLLEMLKREMMDHVLVFTRTKATSDRLADYLIRNGIQCARIHGDRTQSQRTAALDAFREGHQWVLIATDIAARGLDVEDISHVVNFDVPEAPEDYIHRVGRTGRAEQEGDAFTFVSGRDLALLHAIEHEIGEDIPRLELEGFDYDADEPDEEPVDLLARVQAAQEKRNKKGGKRGRGRKGGRKKGKGR